MPKASLKINKNTHRIDLNVLNLGISIYTNSKKLVKYIKRVYSLFEYRGGLKPSRGNFTKKITICLRKRYPEDVESITGLEFELKKAIFKSSEDRCLFLHGSSIIIKNKTIIFIGKSGSGKSTLVSMFSGNNSTVVSDDMTVIDYKAHRILPFPTFSHIRKGVIVNSRKGKKHLAELLKKYKTLRESTLYFMNDQEFKLNLAYHKELYRNRLRQNNTFSDKLNLIFLARSNENTASLEAASVSESFEGILEALFLTSRKIKANFKIMLDVIAHSNCYNLNIGDKKKTIELIKLKLF